MTSSKRTHIISSAQKLFQEKGLGMVTMEDVAKAAGMGKSSIYYYFRSKEEVFNAVFETEINEIILETIRQMSERPALLEKLNTFALVKFEMARKRKSLYKAMEAGMDAEALSRYNDVRKEIHLKYLQQEKVVLQQALITAAAHKEIRELNADKLDEVIFIFLSSVRGMNREINLYGTVEDAGSMLTAFCRFFYEGLR